MHSRHVSAISSSSAVRSPSPSPTASPSSPTAGEGLSRRLSWNRPRDIDNTTTSGSLAPGSRGAYLSTPPVDEYDLGAGTGVWGSSRRDSDPSPGLGSNGRPFFHQFDSQASLNSSERNGSVEDLGLPLPLSHPLPPQHEEDRERLTPGLSPSHHGIGHRRQPSKRVYDEGGGGAGALGKVTRSPTFRHVSRTLRQASVRVVNIMGGDRDGRRTRLDDGDEEDGGIPTPPKMRMADGGDEGMEMHEASGRPDPRPPEGVGGGRLRGRTLGFLDGSSRVRKAMDELLRFPWTEPAILVLIIANVVVLAIQGAAALNEPRVDDGYFRSWEDLVLLVLFGIFTVEMFARIAVTGLLFDPDTSVRASFRTLRSSLSATVLRRVAHTQSSLQRNLSRTGSTRAPWRNPPPTSQSLTPPKPPPRKATTLLSLSEAPFQKAVAKQHLLATQGRPYLRHSWHRIDMLAIIAFWITFFLAISGNEATADRHLYIFRALSVLRAGRLLVITSGTTTILHSLKRAGPLLITVAYYLAFAACIFSIIGVQSFRGSFRRSCVFTDPSNASLTIDLGNQCGGWLDPSSLAPVSYMLEDGRIAEADPKGYICPMYSVCQESSGNPNDGANSFDDIFSSLVQISIITSINTWAPIMYMAMDSDFFASSLFFLAAVIVLNFWLINLLVAVVINTFQSIRIETRKSAFGADDSIITSDPTWATTETKRSTKNVILTAYEKTELVWVLLVLADLIVQALKTDRTSSSKLDLFKNIELAFTFAFDLEMLIRIVAHFPDYRAFFARGRNSFDLFLAIVTSIIQIPVIVAASVYPWLTVFQLLRWYRFILAFPRMKPLLITVFGSFAGLLNMIVFLLLVNFIAALVAIQLFRGDIAVGDTITFSQTYNSFLGMYQIFSSENWTTILYDAMSAEGAYKMRWLAAVFLIGWFLFADFVVLQMFIAVINENFMIAEEQKRKQQVDAFIRRAQPTSAHVSWIDRLNPYRLLKAHHESVKVQTLPPNLVLPLKQNVGPDVGGPPVDKIHKGETKAAMRRLLGRTGEDEVSISLRNLKRPRSATIHDLDQGADDDRGLTDLLPPINAGPSHDEHMDALRERRNQQADFIAAHPSFDRSLWIFRQSNPVRQFCQACFSPAYGDRIFGRPPKYILRIAAKTIIFLAIVASIVVAAIATPTYRRRYYESHGGLQRGTWFDLVEVGLGATFVIEAGMKIIADGFVFAPNAYLLSLWNVLDFVILITLLVNTTTSLIYIGGLSRVTRSLKAFRALRLITLFARLRDTLHAVLFAGAAKILDASVLVILYLIPYAVWGLNIFSGLLFSCNDGNASGLSSCVGEYLATPIDDSLAFLVPRVWTNPGDNDSTSKWNFDSFGSSMLILFEIVSLEGWIDVMSSVMAVTGSGQQPQDLASQWNAIFVVIFNLLGGIVILTLFVSIIIENFSTRSGNALLTREQRRWVDLHKYIKAQTPSQLPKDRPTVGIRAWCYDRAVNKHGFWAQGFTVIYFIHIILLMTETYSQNVLTDAQADWIFLFLTMLYAVDLNVRFFGLGFKSFRANGWNIFDLIVIAGSFATTIPALQAAQAGHMGSQVNTQMQKLFLVSISLKLVQRIGSLNQLFKTSVASLPAIGNLFLLWATLFIFFAILYLEVFGLTKIGNNAGSRFQNYYTFGNALIMLAFMSTGEGWNGYMHDYTIEYPRCTEDDNFLNSDCGSASWAYGLFISWNILSMYIFLNMFTGVVVESFAYVYQMPGGSSLNREEMRAFKKLWAEFDSERTGYLQRKDFVRFFSRLSGVFEVRLYPSEFSIPTIVRGAIPDPVANASGKVLVAAGVKHSVDVRRVEAQISQIDYHQVRKRRQLFARLYNEARISEEPGRGISFTSMLVMLAHHKLIDDENALQLDDLLVRRAKNERVTDLVNLDRVRGLLRTIYWRRRFLAMRDEGKRTLNSQGDGIPAIVLEPMPATPPMDDHDPSHDRMPSPPPSQSRQTSASTSPEMRSVALYSPDAALSSMRHSPSLSVSSQRRVSLVRKPSDSSMLSSEDAHNRDSLSPIDDDSQDVYGDAMATSVWGDMMREAVDREDA